MESVLSLTDSLVNAAGSLDDLVDAWDTYYDKFYSDTEKQTNLQRILTEDLAKYNLTMPTTREGFRAILESIDKIANPQEYVDILNTASDFDKYFTTITDAAQTALDTAKEASSTALDTAKSDLQAAFEAQKTSLQTAYNAQLETLNSHLSDLTENVSKLKSASDKMKLDSVVADAITFTRSKQALMKGVYNDDILNSVSSISASTYADRASYERDYYRIKNQIGKLESDAEGKVSEAQKQIDILTNTYNAQIKAYDDQYNALLKIDKSVLSIADAISVYEAALATYNTANAADATATASTTKVVHLNNAAEMAAYNADVAAGKYYAVTLCPYKEGGDINSDLGLIGENGIEVVDFRQRYVYNNKSTQKILGNEETVAELKALRAELRAEVQDLRAEIARGNQTIRKQYNIYDDWDRRGLPTERT